MDKKAGVLILTVIVILIFIGSYIAYSYWSSFKTIAEIKSDDYVGQKVKVKGVVESSIKIGTFSGYYLKDDTGKIFVASKSIPEEGGKNSVEGIVRKELIVGYYLNAEN